MFQEDLESGAICDLHATYRHLPALQAQLLTSFEKHAKNLSCYEYKKSPRYFVIDSRQHETSHHNIRKKSSKNAFAWNWIRDKRYAETCDDDVPLKKEDGDTKPRAPSGSVNVVLDDSDDYERFYKGKYGIYELNERRKRTVSTSSWMKTLPPLPTQVWPRVSLMLVSISLLFREQTTIPTRACC